MTYLAQHTVGLVALAVCLSLPGCLLERHWLRADPDLRWPARLSLGFGFWIVALFLLALTGGLRRPVLLAVAIATSAVALAACWRRPGALRWPRPSLDAILACAGLAAVLAPLYLLATTPTVSWDANTYHLTVPKLFLAAGGFREIPFNVYSYWPLNVQLLYALAMALQDYVLAKLLHFGFGVLTLLTVVLGCRAFHRGASGALAAAFLLANGVVIFELRIAYVDLAHAFFLLTGFLFMLRALEDQRHMLLLSGICCGLAAGVKVSAVVGSAAVGALYLPRLVREARHGTAPLWSFASRFVAPVIGLWLPWLLRSAWLTGNPVYPFFYGALGGPDWSPELGERFSVWQNSIGMGREPLDYLLLPVRVILSGGPGYPRFDGQLGVFWIAVLPLALWAATQVRLARQCLSVAGLYFVFWALSSQQIRFLIPILPILAIAGGVAIVEILDRLERPAWQRLGLAVVFGATLISAIPGQSRVLAAGYKTLAIYWQAPGDFLASAAHPVFRFIDEQLPRDARVLVLNTNQVFFCQREVLADSFFEASQIANWTSAAKSPAELRRLLEQRGVTHVLLEHRRRDRVDYPPALHQLLRKPSLARQMLRTPDRRFSLFVLL